MNNDRYEEDFFITEDKYSLNNQQIIPIRIPTPPGSTTPDRPNRPGSSPGRPNRPGPPSRPGIKPPTGPPPDRKPQLPRGIMLPPQGSSNFNMQYGNSRRQDMARRFRDCENRFTFVWLWDGSSFWFYPVFTGWQVTEGFVWNRGRWSYDTINLNSIFFFHCF